MASHAYHFKGSCKRLKHPFDEQLVAPQTSLIVHLQLKLKIKHSSDTLTQKKESNKGKCRYLVLSSTKKTSRPGNRFGPTHGYGADCLL